MKKEQSSHDRFLRGLKLKKVKVLSAQIGVLVLFLLVWELITRLEWVDPIFFSSPSRIWRTLGSLIADDNLFKHIGITLLECILGFVIATVLGTAIAIGLWWSDGLRKVFEPYLVILNSLPKIALGPLIIIWVGAGMQAIIVMAVLIAVVITIISMLQSFMDCDPDKILLMKSMGATKTQIFLKLVFPNSIPALISVLKINVGLSWVGTIMGEYIVSSAGLGYLIVYGGTVFKLDLVMTATVILCILATLMYLAVAFVEKLVLKKRS